MPIMDEASAVGATCGDVRRMTMTVSATVVLDGELDCSTERKLEGSISRLAELADVVRIDARQVSFIDAAGVRTLLLAKRDLVKNGGTITVQISRPGPVQRILQLAGLPDRFD
jgi:anti-anti-sigma factor